MRRMIIGCALLMMGSCAAFAQQGPTAPAATTKDITTPSTPAPAVNNPAEGKPMTHMKKGRMHHLKAMHGRKSKMM